MQVGPTGAVSVVRVGAVSVVRVGAVSVVHVGTEPCGHGVKARIGPGRPD